MKKFLIFLLLAGLLTACGKTEEIPEETATAAETEEMVPDTPSEPPFPEIEPRRYVSLGDSIARGYGLSDVKNEVYSAVLTDR
ncbi:MAG: hypothetical protein II333_08605, partial [Clostridia bacterium]|nr:hypothetical protein [Clostridia bacterium]